MLMKDIATHVTAPLPPRSVGLETGLLDAAIEVLFGSLAAVV